MIFGIVRLNWLESSIVKLLYVFVISEKIVIKEQFPGIEQALHIAPSFNSLYFEDKEVPIDPRSEGFKLITRIQDEAHRFAITYHKSLRSEQQVKSVLDEIPGIGPARRKALMRHFASVAEIAAASVEALSAVDGISEAQAKTVYAYFHPEEQMQAVTGGES